MGLSNTGLIVVIAVSFALFAFNCWFTDNIYKCHHKSPRVLIQFHRYLKMATLKARQSARQ